MQGERIDDYIADVTRLCRRLKLSDADSMRYFIQRLQPHIQSYVTLARPTDFQEAESLARMKQLADVNQSTHDSRSILSQMEAMFTKLMAQSKPTNSPTIAAVSTESTQPHVDKDWMNSLGKLNNCKNTINNVLFLILILPLSLSQRTLTQRFSQMCNWSGQPNRQMNQMQRQINRSESELHRYRNPHRPDFRSYGRSFRTVEGDPVCSFCQHFGHNWRNCHQRSSRDPRLPPPQGNEPPRTQFSGRINSREQHPPLNG